MNRRRFVGLVAIAAVLGSLLTGMGPSPTAEAANAQLFSPGNIISDAQFFDGGAMSGPEVQVFLNAQVAGCQSGYTCLKDYSQATPSRGAVSNACSAYAGRASESAADIITRVGAACGISQKAMIVLIEKEQGLISDSSPSSRQYRSATGYGCPDTAACDTTYYGFFNQVYAAALQFNYYANNPTRWNHVPGRVNNVRFHPNAACGAGEVFIENQATAGLYNYTPYQPNPAAMANLYGSGDACSSYGNRNFWRIFSDWFGAPIASTSLFRTPGNSTVYLISGTSKFPVPSMGILTSLSPLGQVAYISQSYLNSFTTRNVVGRSLRSPGGTIYFYDSGIKLPFTSCEQAVDYGTSCASDGYVQLTDAQLAKFQTGPVLGPVLGTVEGSRYFIKSGVKREILDDLSQQAAGIPLGFNVLTENAVSALPLGVPLVRDSAFVATRSTGTFSLLAGGLRHPIGAAYGAAVAQLPTAGSLSAESLSKLSQAATEFNGVLGTDGAQGVYVLAPGGKYAWDAVSTVFGAVPTKVSAPLLNSLPLKGTIAPGSLIKAPDSGTVYVLIDSQIRPIASWEAMLALSETASPTIIPVSTAVVAAIPKGAVALTAGSLVRSNDNATVYLINGVTNRVAFSNFAFPSEAGISGFTFSTTERINAYPLAGTLLTFGITCSGVNYVSAGGSLHEVVKGAEGLYPFNFVGLDQFTCGQLTVGAAATDFLRTPDGSIYHLVAGEKRPVSSMERFDALRGAQTWTSVIPMFAGMIPTGPAA